MRHVRRLFESRPFHLLVPAPSFIKDGPLQGGAKIRAALASDRGFAFVYSPRGSQFSVDLGVFPSPKVRATWFDPRYGAAYEIHTGDNRGVQTFVPPTSRRGQDWLLVLDGVNRGFPLPGSRPDARE